MQASRSKGAIWTLSERYAATLTNPRTCTATCLALFEHDHGRVIAITSAFSALLAADCISCSHPCEHHLASPIGFIALCPAAFAHDS